MIVILANCNIMKSEKEIGMEDKVEKIIGSIIGFLGIIIGLYLYGSGNELGVLIALIGSIIAGVTWWGLIVAILGFLIDVFFHDNSF